MKSVMIRVSGRVQGVGFRWWTQRTADRLGLVGTVENLPDGRVEVHAQGDEASVDALVAALQPGASSDRPGRVDDAALIPEHPDAHAVGFRVR